MPPQLIFDISAIDLDQILHDQEKVRSVNPQRGDMEQLNGIIWADKEQGNILGYKDVGTDEFWIPGHIPGNPLLPGVLMIEAGGQLASFYFAVYDDFPGFIGFGAADNIRFRQPVRPGCRLLLLGHKTGQRHGRLYCKIQGVVDGSLVFEADIVGIVLA
jgi:3-hydroxyacyl-[acyl-carrier-protein] dehydratase